MSSVRLLVVLLLWWNTWRNLRIKAKHNLPTCSRRGGRTSVYQLVTCRSLLAEDVLFPEVCLITVLPATFRIQVPIDINSNAVKIASTGVQAILDSVPSFVVWRSERRKIDAYPPIRLNATCSQHAKTEIPSATLQGAPKIIIP